MGSEDHSQAAWAELLVNGEPTLVCRVAQLENRVTRLEYSAAAPNGGGAGNAPSVGENNLMRAMRILAPLQGIPLPFALHEYLAAITSSQSSAYATPAKILREAEFLRTVSGLQVPLTQPQQRWLADIERRCAEHQWRIQTPRGA